VNRLATAFSEYVYVTGINKI